MKSIFIAAIALSTSVVTAAPIVKSWINPECANGDCEVKAMRIYLEKMNDGRIAATSMVGEIEASTKSNVKKFALVQYIEGCVFETNREGSVKMATREFWGYRTRPFKHVGFELDSASDRDPIYWSNPRAGYDELRGFEIPRNSFYANANPILTESWGSWAGKISNLKDTKVFVQDVPTNSAWDLNSQTLKVTARNSSLKFKICLHRIEDLPARLESPATEIPGAITCMNWDSNYIYNFQTRKFDDKKEEIHPACK